MFKIRSNFLRQSLNVKIYPIIYAEWAMIKINFPSNPLENYWVNCSWLWSFLDWNCTVWVIGGKRYSLLSCSLKELMKFMFLIWRKTGDYQTSSGSRDDYQIGTTNAWIFPSPPGKSHCPSQKTFCLFEALTKWRPSRLAFWGLFCVKFHT